MREIVIDFSDYPDMAAFHDDITEKLALPAYYGRNLDALNDCMREIPPGSCHFTIHYGEGGIPQKKQETIARILQGERR